MFRLSSLLRNRDVMQTLSHTPLPAVPRGPVPLKKRISNWVFLGGMVAGTVLVFNHVQNMMTSSEVFSDKHVGPLVAELKKEEFVMEERQMAAATAAATAARKAK